MAKALYVGVGGVAKKGKKGYVGVGGIAKKIKKMYVGDASGKARLAWSGAQKGDTFNIIQFQISKANASTNSFTTFTECNNKAMFPTSSTPVFYKDKYIVSMRPNGSNTCGIYYSTSLNGAWTLAKSTQYTSSGSTYYIYYDLYIYNDTLYAIEQSRYNGAGGYMKSTNGTSWTFTSGTSDKWREVNFSNNTYHKPFYALYNGKLYISSTYNLWYFDISSMSSATGQVTCTALYSGSQTNYYASNLAIDKEHNIGYFMYNGTPSGSDTPYSCWTQCFSVDLSTGQYKSQGFGSGSSEVWKSTNAYGTLYVHNGVLYAIGGGRSIHANVLSSYSGQLSWTSWNPSASANVPYNIQGFLCYMQDKLITVALSGYQGYGSVYYRTGDSYTVLYTPTTDVSSWYNRVVPTDGTELYNYDLE